jgi:dynein heavy chain
VIAEIFSDFKDEDDETPLTIELASVSNAWRKQFKTSKKYLRINLHPINNCLLQTLTLWYKSYNDVRFINTEKMKQGPKMEMMFYQDFIYQEIERIKKLFKEQWLNNILDIYRNCEKKKQLPPEMRRESFMRGLSVQMTLSIQSLTLVSMKDFDMFISSLNKKDIASQRAGFVQTLKIINNQIMFSPGSKDVKTALLETYDTVLRGACEIPRFQHALDPDEDEKPKCLKPTILQDIIDQVKANVVQVVEEQSKGPQEYIKEYDKFIYLIDGRAESEIEGYIKEAHTFEELNTKVKFFDDLGKTLTDSLPKEVNLGMFELHCEDLIQNLYRKTGVLRESIIKKMSQDHQNDNKRLCAEYEEISDTALSSPSNTEELVR